MEKRTEPCPRCDAEMPIDPGYTTYIHRIQKRDKKCSAAGV